MARRAASVRSRRVKTTNRKYLKPRNPWPNNPTRNNLSYNTAVSRKYSTTSYYDEGMEGTCGGGTVPWYALVPPALLLLVNLCLAVYVGAALATAARLAWDPTAYVPAREMFPAEYAQAVLALPAAAAAMLALCGFGVVALHVRAPLARRLLLILYAALMLGSLAGEALLAREVVRRTRGQLAAGRARLQALLSHVRTVLNMLAFSWQTFTYKLENLLQEAEKTSPMNMEALKWAVWALAGLQAGAALLAALAAALPPWPRAPLPADYDDDED